MPDLLTDHETDRIADAMARGMQARGLAAEDTAQLDAMIGSVLRWARQAKTMQAALRLVLEGQVILAPSPEGDPDAVVLIAADRAAASEGAA
jgi:hypothetical protein